VAPGEGARRPGHDGRAGDRIAAAGERLTARHGLIAARAGIGGFDVRRPRVRVALEDPGQAAFARGWLAALGARIAEGPADLTLRPAAEAAPRLALAPAETAWLGREGDGLALSVPRRFDGMVAACAALALPALAALSGGRARQQTRPVSRKIASAMGLSELVLLAEADGAWAPQPAGTVTLSGLAAAEAFAILPPDSEGLPVGAPLAAIPFDMPFG
jgi:molybdopterin biosynthesis enzyme